MTKEFWADAGSSSRAKPASRSVRFLVGRTRRRGIRPCPKRSPRRRTCTTSSACRSSGVSCMPTSTTAPRLHALAKAARPGNRHPYGRARRSCGAPICFNRDLCRQRAWRSHFVGRRAGMPGSQGRDRRDQRQKFYENANWAWGYRETDALGWTRSLQRKQALALKSSRPRCGRSFFHAAGHAARMPASARAT